jgi:flavin reductase (DIM6/NTAB) family NADH-FMN oxidoreductase RutF
VAADRNPLNALGFARAAAAAAALGSARPDAAASFARDRLTREAAERVAAAELETTRARFECEAVERSEDLFALLDRGYDLPLALRL